MTVLAVQAQSGMPEDTPQTVGSSKPSAQPSRTATPKPQNPVPAESGTGRRVVYSLQQKRVWLVSESDSPLKTFPVWPGTVHPDPGSYKVSFRREQGTGSDGVPIEHAVYFGTNSAFSNAVDGSSPDPNSGLKTGAIRESAADGLALWKFATLDTPVNVVK
ncbi:hypothetical protein ACWHA3_34460 [Streptomyces cyaneofuscatus]